MAKIQVLGSGCAKCEQTAANAKEAVHALGLASEIQKVSQPAEIAKFGVMFTPALVVDGAVKVAGRVPTVDEIKAWLDVASP